MPTPTRSRTSKPQSFVAQPSTKVSGLPAVVGSIEPWYTSKVVWAQIIALIFGLLTIIGVDLSALGLTQEQLLATVMTIIAVASAIWRLRSPKILTTSRALSEARFDR